MSPPQIVSLSPAANRVEQVEQQEKRMPTDQESFNIDEKKEDITPYMQDAFGDEEFAEVKYKVLKWWQCGLLMVAETVSLGVLSLPAAVAGLGLVPAIIILIFFGALATYTGYVIGQFKWKYPHISNMADAGEVLAGKFGRELLGITQTLFLVFIMASHILTFVIAMNTLTEHGTCSIVFGVVGTVVSFVLSLPRTLAKMSWLSLVSFISILSAVIITMIGVGILAPGAGSMQVTVKTDLVHGFTSVTNIVFAFAGHAAFFGFAAELKDPRDFPKALCLLQSIDISLYIIAAVVIYRYGGADVASPALGSASPVVSKVAYGIALPTIIIAGVINGHIAFKYIYIRIFRGTDRMHKRDWVAVSSWIGIAASLWILAWIIAEAIPVFSNLLSLITALFASWFTFGLSGMFWLYMNKGLWFSSPKKILLTFVNLIAIVVAATLCGLGLYVSGKAIHDDPSSASFSCASNA
ncbi:Transmembrane amino acid transporter protein [Aspergillus parasiticus SU-1]|uniref:Transmembrane amino acid transporter protein n=2 Tax=Aspergillus subgen. Circumdati TaxID=2720871 RepID=A0A0F0I5W3_ASPPU|nr:transmembrane amino acid transporter protein-domain-containing protein [Aspergillus transmontanensis]KJK62012.1 Transmembrane amino acid transporter protein [Aspergillus parasiticus SU-1]